MAQNSWGEGVGFCYAELNLQVPGRVGDESHTHPEPSCTGLQEVAHDEVKILLNYVSLVVEMSLYCYYYYY